MTISMRSLDPPPPAGAVSFADVPKEDAFWTALGGQLSEVPERPASEWAADCEDRFRAEERSLARVARGWRWYGGVVAVLLIAALYVFPSLVTPFLVLIPAGVIALFRSGGSPLDVHRVFAARSMSAGLVKCVGAEQPMRWSFNPLRGPGPDLESATSDETWMAAHAPLAQGGALTMELAFHSDMKRTHVTVQGQRRRPSSHHEYIEIVHRLQERLALRVDIPGMSAAWGQMGPDRRVAAVHAAGQLLRDHAPVWVAHFELLDGPAPQLRASFDTEPGEFYMTVPGVKDEDPGQGFMPASAPLGCVELSVDLARAFSSADPEASLRELAAGLLDSDPSAVPEAAPPETSAQPAQACLAELRARRANSRPSYFRLPSGFLLFAFLLSGMFWLMDNPIALAPSVIMILIYLYTHKKRPTGDPRRFQLSELLVSTLAEETSKRPLQFGLTQDVDTLKPQRWLALKAQLPQRVRLRISVDLDNKYTAAGPRRPRLVERLFPGKQRRRVRELLSLQLSLPEPPAEAALEALRAALQQQDGLRLIELSSELEEVQVCLSTPWALVPVEGLLDSMKGEGGVVTQGMLRPAAAARSLRALLAVRDGMDLR